MLWGAVTVVFVVVRVVPADPALLILGPDASPDQVAELREQIELNTPLFVQYADYLSGVIALDFGQSYRAQPTHVPDPTYASAYDERFARYRELRARLTGRQA